MTRVEFDEDVDKSAFRHASEREEEHPDPPPPGPELIKTPSGQIKPLLANAITILRTSPSWRGVLGYDAFAMQTVALRRPPWEAQRNAPFEVRPWTPHDDVLAANVLQHAGVSVSVEVTQAALEAVARDNNFHPVKDYLDGLLWDGRTRLDGWLSTYLGAEEAYRLKEGSSEEERESLAGKIAFTRAVARRFLISAVARIYQPGCKADVMLVLEGVQGAGKSSIVRALGEPWTSDELADFGSKDAALQMRSVWLMEVPELDAMNRSEVTRIKAFLSRSTDRFRPPYGRRVIEAPRESVLIGTTNAHDYLKDETGGRRFWPVKIGKVDLEGLRSARDQLWAEAVMAYRAKQKWWLDQADLLKAAEELQAERLVEDPWHNRIATHVLLGKIQSTTVGLMLEGPVGLPAERWGQAEQNRVARILKSLGFSRHQTREGERREWRYIRHS